MRSLVVCCGEQSGARVLQRDASRCAAASRAGLVHNARGSFDVGARFGFGTRSARARRGRRRGQRRDGRSTAAAPLRGRSLDPPDRVAAPAVAVAVASGCAELRRKRRGGDGSDDDGDRGYPTAPARPCGALAQPLSGGSRGRSCNIEDSSRCRGEPFRGRSPSPPRARPTTSTSESRAAR